MRIFIVDDEEIACRGLKGMVNRILKDENNEIYTFTSPIEALGEAEKLRPDIIFLDIIMPELDGIGFTKQIKRIYSPEIVIISGNDDYNYVRQCFKYGARDYILKPIEFDELREFFNRLKNSASVGNVNIPKPDFPYLFTAVVKGADIREELIFAVASCAEKFDDGTVEVVSSKEQFSDVVFTFYFSDKLSYYSITREFENIFKNFASLTPSVLKAAYSSLYHSTEEDEARSEMFMLLQSRIYSSQSECYNQQNKVYRDNNDNEDFFKSAEKLPQFLSFADEEEYSDFSDFWFTEAMLFNLPYRTIGKQYEEIISKIISATELDEGLEIRNFRDFNTIDEIVFEVKRVIDGVSNYYLENNQNDKNVIDTAIKYINENYQKNISLAIVSNYYNLNYSYFSRMFKKVTGISFSQYLLKVRMEKAKELLISNQNLKISDIARLVGYNEDNVQNFTRAFKNHFGKSPKNFKK